MGKVFSDQLEKALELIYYNERAQRGAEGLELLAQAVEQGDADAMCILGRCFNGPGYVWAQHNFPTDYGRATGILHRSVECGSALGVLVTIRSGDMTPSLEQKMPFDSLQEAFDIVEKNARKGDPFCQYTVGTCYFWRDFLQVQNKGRNSFPSEAAYRAYLRENILKCEDWLWRAFRGGMYLAGLNLNHLYTQGEEDIIQPQPEKARDIFRIGAEYGYPRHQYDYARSLKESDPAAAARWFKAAADGGDVDACLHLGLMYEWGDGVAKDLTYAAQCYERCLLNSKHLSFQVDSAILLGMLWYDGLGVPQDYAKAWQLLSWAWQQDPENIRGIFYLAACCFYGRGVQQDYALARKFLDLCTLDDKEVHYMRGCLLCNGLGGMAEDIKAGVALLQRAGNYPPAREELLRYKRGVFGKWSRR